MNAILKLIQMLLSAVIFLFLATVLLLFFTPIGWVILIFSLFFLVSG